MCSSDLKFYDEMLEPLEKENLIDRPFVPEYACHNAHMYYIKAKDLETRGQLISFLRGRGIQAVFHYIPLHLSLIHISVYFFGLFFPFKYSC